MSGAQNKTDQSMCYERIFNQQKYGLQRVFFLVQWNLDRTLSKWSSIISVLALQTNNKYFSIKKKKQLRLPQVFEGQRSHFRSKGFFFFLIQLLSMKKKCLFFSSRVTIKKKKKTKQNTKKQKKKNKNKKTESNSLLLPTRFKPATFGSAGEVVQSVMLALVNPMVTGFNLREEGIFQFLRYIW